VASILPFIRKSGAVFDDNALVRMGAAFDAACRELHDSGQPAIVYEVLAGRIIEAALQGTLDEAKLREVALAAFKGQKRN
jgi:hypothetical protein